MNFSLFDLYSFFFWSLQCYTVELLLIYAAFHAVAEKLAEYGTTPLDWPQKVPPLLLATLVWLVYCLYRQGGVVSG